MIKIASRIILTFIAFLGVFLIQKPMFMAIYAPLLTDATASELWQAVWHGLPMDCCMAGYFTIVPALCAIAQTLTASRISRYVLQGYFLIASLLTSIIIVADLALYGYWGFRLDTTPIFYFTTSPSAAMASAPWWQIVLAMVGIVLLTIGIFQLLKWVTRLTPVTPSAPKRCPATAAAIVLTALLFIPIRGGVTVSTMNLSRAYFSNNQRLNHAAINPAFILLYSATHNDRFADQYQSFPPEEAQRIFAEMAPIKADTLQVDTALLSTNRPDICLIILESFSAHLMPTLGGEPIAMRLDSLAREGLLFSNFYASSFRTDRALPAILSGWPAQPSTSLMKFAKKVEHIPSWPRRLADECYDLAYYYGGDINFTNMLAYLVSMGFGTVVRDTDFPVSQRASKWGAPDHAVFQRALASLRQPSPKPRLSVIQTSSSHEPFDVPYHNPAMPSPQANAFAYADSCLGAFVDSLKATPAWDRTLLVMVPDHYGAWPQGLEDPRQRHHVPLVLSGGALRLTHTVDSLPASQPDIAATLLAALGISHDEFAFSNDLRSSKSRRQAFLADPSLVTLVTDSTTTSWNPDADLFLPVDGSTPSPREQALVKAYLQTLYQNISDL